MPLPSWLSDVLTWIQNSLFSSTPNNLVIIVVVNILVTVISVLYQGHLARNNLRVTGLRQEELLLARRRLAEHNVDVSASVELLYSHEADGASGLVKWGSLEDPFVSATFHVHNVGDGPVDLLACLISGRELASTSTPGLGTQGRDIQWTDLTTYYWNADVWQRLTSGATIGGAQPETIVEASPVADTTPADTTPIVDIQLDTAPSVASAPPAARHPSDTPIFRGLSTTKLVMYTPEHLLRLDPREHESLIRIDALENKQSLIERGHLNLIYKVFTAVLAYPLDVLYSPQERLRTAQRAEALRLTDAPDFVRWLRIQRTLATLNRFPFRLALEQRQLEENERAQRERRAPKKFYANDPIGRLADPIGWRCFLLYHWDFDEGDTKEDREKSVPGLQQRGNRGVLDPFGNRRVEQRRKAQSGGVAAIKIVEEVRAILKDKNGEYDIYNPSRSDDMDLRQRARHLCRNELALLLDAWINLIDAIEHCKRPEVGFARFVTSESEWRAKERWSALQSERYLYRQRVSRRWFQRLWPLGGQDALTSQEIWTLERYKMSTSYMLVTLKAPGHTPAAKEAEHMPTRRRSDPPEPALRWRD